MSVTIGLRLKCVRVAYVTPKLPEEMKKVFLIPVFKPHSKVFDSLARFGVKTIHADVAAKALLNKHENITKISQIITNLPVNLEAIFKKQGMLILMNAEGTEVFFAKKLENKRIFGLFSNLPLVTIDDPEKYSESIR